MAEDRPESAFAQDELRRRQQEAETALRKSIGVQDENGEQLHGHERTIAQRAMRQAARDNRHPDRVKPPDPLQGNNPMRISINAPHRVMVHGNQAAFTIQAEPAPPPVAADNSFVSGHPFQITLRISPGSDPVTLDRIVESSSRVVTSLVPLTATTPSGVASSMPPTEADTHWEPLQNEDLIWIEASSFATLTPSVEIKSLGAGDTWPDFPADDGARCLVEWSGTGTGDDPFIQTKSRAIIARAPEGEGGLPRLVQVAFSDFLLVDFDINGKVMRVFVPFAGGQ